MRTLALIALLAALAPGMIAQRAMSSAPHFAASRPQGNASVRSTATPSGAHDGSAHHRRVFYPFGLYSDPFYSDALFSTGYPVAAEPPLIIMQNPPQDSPPADSSKYAPTPVQPLMIELRGDQYVRVSGDDDATSEMIDRNSHPPYQPANQPRHATEQDLSPAVLVFRDGRREEVSEYAIADGVLYTTGDYYNSGSWNQKIELSSLNLPETIKSNRSRGVPFRLPNAPNEVITRP